METDIDALIQHPQWTVDDEKLIRAPFDYLAKSPGKQLRTQLIQTFNSILKIPNEKLDIISTVIEMLHTASLLIDDIEDDSNLRRGKPTAHLVYGIPYTINSSNYIYFQTLQELLKLADDSITESVIIRLFNEELLNLHRGQSLDLYWRDNLIIPTEKDYINMVMNKTGGLFRLSVRLMELFSERKFSSLVPLANLLGILYQIKDDYLNLKNEKLQQNKGFCEDISEGKFSFPIIHSLRVNPSDKTLIGILKQRTQNDQIKSFAIEYLEKTNSFEYTLNSLNEVKIKAIKLVNSQEDHDIFEGLVKVIYLLSTV